jgi:folate-binding protein YgfZ
LLPIHAQGAALLAPYGPPTDAVQLVEAFDPVEIEYASIRRHAAVFDAPHRGTLVFKGPDRVALLNRMLTQDLKDLPDFTSRRAFLLNRKGRIDADLRLISLPDQIVADVDLFAATRARTELDKYIITEDVSITDASAETCVLSMHGPAAAAILARVSSPVSGPAVADLRPGQACVIRIGDDSVLADRCDWAAVIGIELRTTTDAVSRVYEAISTPWSARTSADAITPSTDRARRIGWHALNIARIEAGTALYMLDYGPDSLPHETGDASLAEHVSFTKGCYLGQEIVARMQALGHPKQKIVSLRIDPASGGEHAAEAQAVTGTPVVEADAPDAKVVGAVTSSCLSPMLSQTPIALAMIKFSHTQPGQKLWLQLDNARLEAVVQPTASFLPAS